jgi:prepilin-type N-terminal cleavage/methylation domain-containing protein
MKRGFTLTELLITAIILSVVFAAMIMLLTVTGREWNPLMSAVNLQEEARKGMDALVKDLRGATVTSNTANSITFNTDTETGVQCYLDATGLVREYPLNTKNYLGHDITTLSFCWLHTDGTCCTTRTSCGSGCGSTCSSSYLLQISLASSKTSRGRAMSFPLTGSLVEKVRLRNE